MFELFLILFLLFMVLLLLCIFCLFLLRVLLRRLSALQMPHLKEPTTSQPNPVIVGFFHPYCNAGGGGERVLWESIKALQNRYNNVRCVVYTGDWGVNRDIIISKIKDRFNITIPRTDPLNLSFIYLKTRVAVEASTYKHFTLIGQSLGSMVLGFEALLNLIPHVYIDTMGYAFTFPIFSFLASCPCACYVHYPTISSDMLEFVAERRTAHNNSSFVSSFFIFTWIKLIYYKIFALLYGAVGSFAEVVMVNSTWTRGHIREIWRVEPRIVYPPCNVEDFLSIPLDSPSGQGDPPNSAKFIVSIAQFRPEKNHMLQLKSFKKFLEKVAGNTEIEERKELKESDYKLVLVGSCRNEEDERRVGELKMWVEENDLQNQVLFLLNVSFEELKDQLRKASVGLHSMWNEHFGIGIVECMAAGVIMLAHESGGPKVDIVVPFQNQTTGFLASDEESYSETLIKIFSMSSSERDEVRKNARKSVERFSDSHYDVCFLNSIQSIFSRF